RIVTSQVEIGLLAIEDNDWTAAAAHVELARGTIRDVGLDDYAMSALTYAASARLALHRGDLTEATAELTRAMRARPAMTHAMPFLAVRLRLWLARIHMALSDHAA